MKSEGAISLSRDVEAELIKVDLRELTSGRRYNSYNNFIEAVEGRGYHVHLRYDNGLLSGYTIHKGTEHFHDKEVADGKFSLNELRKRGVFQVQEVARSVSMEFQTSLVSEMESVVERSSVPKRNTSESLNQRDVTKNNQVFDELDLKKKREREKQRAKDAIARELAKLIHSFKTVDQPFDAEKYLAKLQANNFEVIRHYNSKTNALRGYSLRKLGFIFPASEIGGEFTLKSLEETPRAREEGQKNRKKFQARL
jgi:hypothetical protein